MSNNFKVAVAKFRSFSRAVRWSTYALSAYLFYAALLGLLVPYIAKQQIPEQVSKLTERPVTLTDVTINPFTLQFDVHQFAILEQEKPFVSFENASIKLSFWQSIFNGALSVEYINLDKPYINLERLNNNDELLFNFSDILEAVARNTTSVEQPEPKTDDVVDRHAPLFPVLIKQTALTQGDIRFLDGVTGTQLDYPNINITLGEFSTQSLLIDVEQKNQYKLHITDADSATVELTGQVQLKPLQVVGSVDVKKVQLPRLWGFIAKDITAKLTSGDVSFSSNYQIVQTIGETVADDAMSISTSNGQFAVHELNFDAGEKSIVSLPNFSVNDIATNVDSQTINIASITSQGLNVSAKVDSEGADLVALFTPKSLTQESQPHSEGSPSSDVGNTTPQSGADSELNAVSSEEGKAPSWLVTLNGIELKDYQLNVEEKVVTKKANQWLISPINITTKQIVSDFSKPIEFALATSVNGKGDISVKGQADAKQQAVLADIAVKSLKLAQFQPYLATAVNATLTNGEMSTQLKLDANAAGKVTVSGGAQVNQLSIRDNKLRKPFVKWRSLAVNKFNFDLQKSKLDIDTLSLSQPYARVVINKDRSTNIGDLIVAQPSNKKATRKSKPANKQDKPFALSVRKIAFNNGSAFFADNSLTPNFSSGIEQLKGNIGHVSSVPGTKASVDISGNIDRYAPVKVKGEINPLLDQPYLDLDVIFQSVELTTVNPYSGTYAGHYIDRGQLSLSLNYQLENNQLKGSNHVVIDQLQLGKASESDLATDLPISLAIALLQDSDGVIDLGVEVSGDVDDPEFSLGAVIWSTISNIITKAVTAPFSFIAGLADSDDELNVIEFEFGANTLTTDEQEKLQTLGSALETRPKLTLTVDGSVDAVQDSKALALQQLNQLLAETAKTPVAQLPVNLSASTMPTSGLLSEALQAVYQAEFGEDADTVRDTIEDELDEKGQEYTDSELDQRWHIALYNLVLNKQEVDKGQLGHLAQQRAQAVKAYLVDTVKVDASRVFLLDSRFDIEQDSSSVLLSLEAK
ncbi:MAG TPA: ATPase [Vibrio sp.]|nr:ATPase [Vibrio sp.]